MPQQAVADLEEKDLLPEDREALLTGRYVFQTFTAKDIHEAKALCGIDHPFPLEAKILPKGYLAGKTLQIVGGSPTGRKYLRPQGVDAVWGMNARYEYAWDAVVSADIFYTAGRSKIPGVLDGYTPPPHVEAWRTCAPEGVMLILTPSVRADAYRVNEDLSSRGNIFEIPFNEIWDGEVSAFCGGWSLGLALAAAEWAAAKAVVITGCDLSYTEEELNAVAKMRGEVQALKNALQHVAKLRGGITHFGYGPQAAGVDLPLWANQL